MEVNLTDITYSYPLPGGGYRPALKGLSLTIKSGSCLGVIGPEGAGKTTLLLLLDLLLQPDEGNLSFGGRKIGTHDAEAGELRKKIGMEFQFPEQQFVAESVREELTFGLDATSRRMPLGPEQALSAVGLEPGEVLDRSPFLLSMGEARRVALATLLLRDPEMLLLDEPTAGLDGSGREDFIRALKSQTTAQKTMVIVSHDLDFLAEVSSTIAVLRDGCLLGMGGVGSVLSDAELLNQAGYEKPEHMEWLEALMRAGKIPQGSFCRADEIEQLLNDASSGMQKEGK